MMTNLRIDEQPWWASLRHGGMLISPSRLASAEFPTSVAPLSDYMAGKLRADLAKADQGGEALATTLLESVCGLTGRWTRGSNVPAEWSRRISTGEQVRPRRVWHGPNGSVLPVFVDSEARLGIGRGKRSVSRVVEWMRGGDQRLAVITNYAQWRIVYAGLDYDAWVESDSALWFEGGEPGPRLDALRILLSPDALTQPAEGQPSSLMRAILDSRKGEAELSAELGERVRKAVEELIQGCAGALDEHGDGIDRADIYRAACRMIMRLVVALFSEARGLLPVDNPNYYNAYSVGALRTDLQRHDRDRLRHRHSAWPRLLALFRLIHAGSPHQMLPIPEYGGGLFRRGDAQSEDAILRAVALFESLDHGPDDARVAEILKLVCVTRTRVRIGRTKTWITAPVDFSDLSTEYIGILYEGLLDFELRRADDTMLFLNIGDQPALPLSRLEGMDDKALAALFEKFKAKKAEAEEGDEAGDEEEAEEAEDDTEDVSEDDAPDDVDEEEPLRPNNGGPEEEEPLRPDNVEPEDLRDDCRRRVLEWSRRAAIAGKLVAKPRGKKVDVDYDDRLTRAAKGLIALTVLPEQWYLVRWGGTRKGAGTFYTRPSLAVPTVHRTLRPLAYDGPADELGPPALWSVRSPEAILDLKVCDPAMGSGSFLVASLRYLTDALFESLCAHKWIAETENGVAFLTPPEPKPAWLVEALRDMPATVEDVKTRLKRVVVERCIYGVDYDALAVELGKLALWVETMDKYLPFEFLDHKLKHGNSLVGCWLDRAFDYPVMAWDREGGDTNHATANHPKNKHTSAIKSWRSGTVRQQVAGYVSRLGGFGDELFGEPLPEIQSKAALAYHSIAATGVEETGKRERLYEALSNDEARRQLRLALDTWCSVWFWPADDLENAPLPASFFDVTDEERTRLRNIVGTLKFFHWEFEFSDVFSSDRSGFDAIVGNPPWEVQKPNSKEFFSNHDPLYRAYGKQEAIDRQRSLFEAEPKVEEDWISYNGYFKSMSNWVSHAGKPFGDPKYDKDNFSLSRSAAENAIWHDRWRDHRSKRLGYADGRHPFVHQGSADINTYKLFLELGHALLKDNGRLGFIVPSGIYTDKGSTDLRALFLERCRWQWLFGFENRDKVFDIDERFKFCPVIVTKGGKTQAVKTAFMRRDVMDWETAEQFIFAYTADEIAMFNAESLAMLEVQSSRDMSLLAKLHHSAITLRSIVDFTSQFDMSIDSRLFPPITKWLSCGYSYDNYRTWHLRGADDGLPVLEGRMIDQFDFMSKGWVSGKGRTAEWRSIPQNEKRMEPQYLMATGDYDRSGLRSTSARIAYMKIGSSTNSRTFYGAVIPDLPTVYSICLLIPKKQTHISEVHALVGCLNSFVYDFMVRLRLGGLNITGYVLRDTPIPLLRSADSYIAKLSVGLSYTSQIHSPEWLMLQSRLLGRHAWKMLWAVSVHERLRLRSMLDAVVAQLYGLDFDDLAWILRDCDHPVEQINNKAFARTLDPKGFWRVDKQQQPELRHTVLTLAAFADLKRMISARGGDVDAGIADFCNQNDGDGWMLPETLRLSDLGLGHDDRARKPQPVRDVLGPRFLPWQLEQTPEESWAECERHARNLLGEAGFNKLQAEIAAQNGDATVTSPARETITIAGEPPMPMDPAAYAVAGETDLFGVPMQKDLFGNVVEERSRKGKR